MPTAIDSTLGALQLAATLSGVPFASGAVMLLQSISATCSQVAVHKVGALVQMLSFAELLVGPCLPRALRQNLHNLCKGVRRY